MIDEETGEEGFFSQFNDTFYTPKDEWATQWDAAFVAGRFLRKSNSKRARKGKRGKNKRGKIRPRKFKNKGRARIAEYEDDYWDLSYEKYDYGEESYYGYKGGKCKYRKSKGEGKSKGTFPFEKGYEAHEQKGWGKTKGQ